MNTILKQILIISSLIILLVLPFFVFAANPVLNSLTNVGIKSGYYENTDEYSFSVRVGVAIKSFFSLLGVIFVVLLIYGGFKWMKASGRSEEVEKAQSIIRQAIIGLIITTSSWAISIFVLNALTN